MASRLRRALALLLLRQQLSVGFRRAGLEIENASALLERGNVSDMQRAQADHNISLCECRVDPGPQDDVTDWLKAAGHLKEQCCEDYGSIFGWYGSRLCPRTILEVLASAERGATDADGGASGSRVVITAEYVVKTIPHQEARLVSEYIAQMRLRQWQDGLSLIAPVCRLVSLGSRLNMVIMPNMMVQGVSGAHRVFDLKGNWGWKARKASWEKHTWKDANFYDMFPDGLVAEWTLLMGEHVKDGGLSLINTLMIDTMNLADQKAMDYSLFLDMVDLCPLQITATGFGTFNKTEVQTSRDVGFRPVYMNSDKYYVHFDGYRRSWVVGRHYGEDALNGFNEPLYSAPLSETACPHEATNWQDYRNQFNPTWRPSAFSGVQVETADTVPVKRQLQDNNANKPLLWVEVDGFKFAMSISIIDVAMHEDRKGFWNTVGHFVSFAKCMPNDIDPLHAAEYRARFLRMVGYADPKFRTGDRCGTCLGSGPGYTYLSTMFQKSRAMSRMCEWLPV